METDAFDVYIETIRDRGWREPCKIRSCISTGFCPRIYPHGFRTVLVSESADIGCIPVPRCASTNIRQMMKPASAIQVSSSAFLSGLPSAIFAVIRSPFDRFVSSYFRQHWQNRFVTTRLKHHSMPHGPERFLQFVRDLRIVGLYDGHLLSQCSFVRLGVPVDFILMDSYFSNSVSEWMALHGVQKSMLHRGRVKTEGRVNELRDLVRHNDEAASFVREWYAEDIRLHKLLSGGEDKKC